MSSAEATTAASFPPPTSTRTYAAIEKVYTLQPLCDIGAFLNHINIQPFERIIINLRPGDYHWEENVDLPEHSSLKIVGEGFINGGHGNKAHIFISHKYTYTYEGTDYSKNARLMIGRDATAEITGVNIKETINDKRKCTPCSVWKGVFNLVGDGARFYLCQGEFEVSSSPFINVAAHTLGRVLLGHSHFKRLASEGSGIVQIVTVDCGWNFGGSKAIVSCSHTHFDAGCALGGEKAELLK